MKVVKVYGALRELLGASRFEFVADTPAQAIRALLVNFPQLEKWMADSEKNGVSYRVTLGKQKIHNDDVSGLFLPWSEQEVFSIAPVLTGAGNTLRIIAGVALIAAAVIIAAPLAGAGGGGFFAAGAAGSTMSAVGIATVVAGNIGIALVLGGVAGLLSPTPKPISSSREEPTQLESNSFSGIVNTTRQGVPVPIAYGRVFVGSAIISAGLDVDQI